MFVKIPGGYCINMDTVLWVKELKDSEYDYDIQFIAGGYYGTGLDWKIKDGERGEMQAFLKTRGKK